MRPHMTATATTVQKRCEDTQARSECLRAYASAGRQATHRGGV
jgi:hypothetical protein